MNKYLTITLLVGLSLTPQVHGAKMKGAKKNRYPKNDVRRYFAQKDKSRPRELAVAVAHKTYENTLDRMYNNFEIPTVNMTDQEKKEFVKSETNNSFWFNKFVTHNPFITPENKKYLFDRTVSAFTNLVRKDDVQAREEQEYIIDDVRDFFVRDKKYRERQVDRVIDSHFPKDQDFRFLSIFNVKLDSFEPCSDFSNNPNNKHGIELMAKNAIGGYLEPKGVLNDLDADQRRMLDRKLRAGIARDLTALI